MIKIQHAVREHGAEAVYLAACAAMDGDYSKLSEMGIEAKRWAMPGGCRRPPTSQ